MAKTNYQSVDAYLKAQPEPAREILKRLRALIRKAVPAAEEGISYQMPTYKLEGTPVIYFAGWKEHYSLYPAGDQIVTELKEELAPYEVRRGTIRFPLDAPMPVRLIGRIVRLRLKHVRAAKAGTSKPPRRPPARSRTR